jgi:hypothetical protein
MNEDLLVADYRLAVRVAGVIDVAGITAASRDRSVDHRFPVQSEEKSVVTLHSGVVVAAIRFGIADPFALVLQNSGSLSNESKREYAAPVNPRAANDIKGLSPIV